MRCCHNIHPCQDKTGVTGYFCHLCPYLSILGTGLKKKWPEVVKKVDRIGQESQKQTKTVKTAAKSGKDGQKWPKVANRCRRQKMAKRGEEKAFDQVRQKFRQMCVWGLAALLMAKQMCQCWSGPNSVAALLPLPVHGNRCGFEFLSQLVHREVQQTFKKLCNVPDILGTLLVVTGNLLESRNFPNDSLDQTLSTKVNGSISKAPPPLDGALNFCACEIFTHSKLYVRIRGCRFGWPQ